MTRKTIIAAAIFAAWLAMPARAEDVTIGSIKIAAPWARATPKGASVGGGYMKITNTGNAVDRLVSGTTDIANRFEMHQMKMDNGVMKMRPVAGGIEIMPGQTVELDPAGFHIMLVGLKKQLNQGDHFKATLTFEKAGKGDVDFTVGGIGAKTGGDGNTMPAMPGMPTNR
jgi:copper(I)-binding protein